MNISIVIPTYNRRDLLERCLSSLLNQDYPRNKYEIIVVDDCSKDNTKELVKKLQLKNKNIRYIRHEKNKGVAAARNTGIKNSKGRIIAIVADDYILPKDYIKTIIRSFRNKNISLVNFRIIGDNNNFISKIFQNYKDYGLFVSVYEKKNSSFFIKIPSKKILKKSKIIPASGAAAFKKQIFKKFGFFDENLRTGEDTDFGYRLDKSDIRIYYNNYINVHHRYRNNFLRMMKQLFGYGESCYYIKKKNSNCEIVIPNDFANFLRLIIEIFYRPIQRCRYLKSLREIIIYYPFFFLLDLSRVFGIFYGYKEDVFNSNTNI